MVYCEADLQIGSNWGILNMKHVDSTCENADLANESHDDPAAIQDQ